MFNLKQPCDQCPFVKGTDMNQTLSKGRMKNIIDDLLTNDKRTFTCHKTIDYNASDEDKKPIGDTNKEQLCHGSMVYLEKMGRPHISQRLAYAFGLLDFKKMRSYAHTVIDGEQLTGEDEGY